MSKFHHFNRLNMQALVHEAMPIAESTLLQDLERLAQEAHGLSPDSTVKWQAKAELRPGVQAEEDVWLHLSASAVVPLTCQRCMSTVAMPLKIDQWFRFVATEAIAMEQDDASEEDLLVMEPQFDLLSVLEDELLMALPLVPMHSQCPVAPVMQAGEEALAPETGEDKEKHEKRQTGEKTNPFAVLALLKNKNDGPQSD